MKKQTTNKRVFYTYLDYKKGLLTSYIDLDMGIDEDFLPDWELQKYVKRKWNNLGYKGGILDSVTIDIVK